MEKAIFLDRDGTINEDVGDFCTPDRLLFIPGSIEALRMLQENFFLFIVTNQSGIGKGIFSEEEFLKFNEYFEKILKNERIDIKHIYFCPHTIEEKCICRKPSPYFLKKAEKDFRIDLKNSYVIGDHPSDMELAKKVAACSVYLLTGHGKKHEKDLLCEPDFIANNLYESALRIVSKSDKEM
ncbi:MAG: D-glycero-alpha-D-manno-heptose-1,7-bisphosphate 7-phosphatase [bacterium]